MNTAEKIAALQESVESVIRGKHEAVKLAMVALLARGHLLIEDVPGIGKTTLANALAKALGLTFKRIQFTSDLLPSDVTGLSVFNQKTGEFEWNAGPIFANVVLADEINRATPKAQSALLEAMAEEQVTADGITRPLPAPFIVIATQNPSEHHGTYPLPESQLDRFMLRLNIGYPHADDEKTLLRDRELSDPIETVRPVIHREDVLELQALAAEVRVDDILLDYLLKIVAETRSPERIRLGASPRASLALFRVAQALALVEGRSYCIADDIKRSVIPCFSHRIVVGSRSGSSASDALNEILDSVPVPV
ncbi:MAG: MoxR family ATPase [Chloracidobacterium sp.]|nr:MoxR family ATPase [Chloracidobacterium sp.]MCC6826211.1 MoxR family ATPase [Acidobacteriota bacterium]